MKTRLKIILREIREDVAKLKLSRPISELKAMIRDVEPCRDFTGALRPEFGLIAEIKNKSPSAGSMRPENVRDTNHCYEHCDLVKTISVLTNKHFGMSIENLRQAKRDFSKPILRKDFIIDEYQIYEAKAFGADAILFMGNVLTKDKLQKFWRLAQELNLEVLFESHTRGEIKNIPSGARLCGINCRLMDSSEEVENASWISPKLFRMFHTDVDMERFSMITGLPPTSVKVAESGLSPKTIKSVKDRGFNAALIGTSLLTDSSGLPSALDKFDQALGFSASRKSEVGARHAVTA
jgi:indole-3-glycerol phosphate synthase